MRERTCHPRRATRQCGDRAPCGDCGCGTRDNRVDHRDDAGRGDECLVAGRRADVGESALEDSRVVVVSTRHEVGLELWRELEVRVADAIHSLNPASVLEIHLREAQDRRPTEEIEDGQQHECEGDEAGAEVGRLGDECECHHGARERGQEDRRPAHCLRVDEASRGEQAPVLGRQDLERVRAHGHLGRGRVERRVTRDRGRTWVQLHAER